MICDLEYKKKHRIVFCKVKAGHYRVFQYPSDGQNILQRRVDLGYVCRGFKTTRWLFVFADRSKGSNTWGDTRCAAIEAAYHFEFLPDQKEAE